MDPKPQTIVLAATLAAIVSLAFTGCRGAPRNVPPFGPDDYVGQLPTTPPSVQGITEIKFLGLRKADGGASLDVLVVGPKHQAHMAANIIQVSCYSGATEFRATILLLDSAGEPLAIEPPYHTGPLLPLLHMVSHAPWGEQRVVFEDHEYAVLIQSWPFAGDGPRLAHQYFAQVGPNLKARLDSRQITASDASLVPQPVAVNEQVAR